MNYSEKLNCSICPEKILSIPASTIFEYYGFEHQIAKTIEELGELEEILEGTSYWWTEGMPLSDENRAAILTECADVIIMCAQLLRLDDVLYPVRLELNVQRLYDKVTHYGAALSGQHGPAWVAVHDGLEIIADAIRLAVAITGKKELQEEILFKIRRQEKRISDEIAEVKVREAIAKKERAAIRSAKLEAKRVAKNAAKLAASTKKEETE